MSNDFACWHTHDTPLRFIWELSRFPISLHLSWLYFDKTALDKPIFFYPLLYFNSIYDAPRKHPRVAQVAPRCNLSVATRRPSANSLQALGMLQGCWQGKPDPAVDHTMDGSFSTRHRPHHAQLDFIHHVLSCKVLQLCQLSAKMRPCAAFAEGCGDSWGLGGKEGT